MILPINTKTHFPVELNCHMAVFRRHKRYTFSIWMITVINKHILIYPSTILENLLIINIVAANWTKESAFNIGIQRRPSTGTGTFLHKHLSHYKLVHFSLFLNEHYLFIFVGDDLYF